MFLSEWRQFPSASCLSGEKKLEVLRLDVVEIACVPDMLPGFLFLLGLRTYQHPGKGKVHPCTGTKALYRPYSP